MTPATFLLIVVVFLAALALLFVVAKALRSWVFELSPGQWIATVILVYSLGALTVAYLVGDGEIELLAALPIVVALIWWIVAAWQRSSSRGAADREAA